MNSISHILDLNIALPEIFLSLWLLAFIPLGVYSGGNKSNRQSYFSIFSIFGLLGTLLILLMGDNRAALSFYDLVVTDRLATYLKSLILFSAIIVLIISEKYRSIENLYIFEYPLLILFSILGMLVMLSSNDFITLYLGLELQSLALYVLASTKKDSLKSSEAGLKYFILGALASGFFLFGVSLLFGITGTTSYTVLSFNTLNPNEVSLLLIFSVVLIISSIAFKLSIAPFHMWTPDVYEGSPTSVTNFFAVVPKIAGLAVLIRFMQVPFVSILEEWQLIIIFISIASMILGAVAAIGQNNIKRLMAYSSIGHIGFALAGIATGAVSGYANSVIYITIYVVMNIGAFGCIFLMRKDGKYLEEISDLSGISKNQPLLALAFLIILFSLAGIPPLAGFFAKFYIFMSVIENGMYPLAIIGLLSTVVSAFYYLKVIKVIYFDDFKESFDQIKNISISGTIFLSCIFLITFFLYPAALNDIINSIFVY